MDIKDILAKDEYEKLSQFNEEDKDWINGRIYARKDGQPGVECIVRGMNRDGDYFKLTPEEIVRQHYAYKLLTEYNYSKDQISFEEPVFFAGKSKIGDKRTDIAVFDKEHKKIDMIIEVKRPSINDYNKVWDAEGSTPFQQMQTYCNQKHPQVGVIVNGNKKPEFYDAPDYETELIIDRFPQSGEDITEWKENRRFTLKQLMQSDRLQTETLKDIILNVEQRFGANDSSDKAFEEIFKLIFTKLYDEAMSGGDADIIANDMVRHNIMLKDIDDSDFRVMEFRVFQDESPEAVYTRINKLYRRARERWVGIFPSDSAIEATKDAVKSCVKELQNVKLFNSNLEVVDDAFEYLINQNQKEGMGQYFTPRYVIDMCVKMLNPRPEEKMIDTAAGSCGFPMHSIFHVWKQINPEASNLFTTRKRKPEETEYVQNNVFGIDFSEKSVRVGRMLNIIAGDGHTNVIELNSLDYKNWEDLYIKDRKWYAKYGSGFSKLEALSSEKDASASSKRFEGFDFDVLMANPPFAGDLDNREQLTPYILGHKNGDVSKAIQNKVGRDILFIERNLNFLKPGGRMAVVLPQGRFNNATDKYIRDYITDRCRLLAVVGLHGNVFKPHTGTKTSVLFVQKWTDEECGYPNICPKPEADENGEIDYHVFFATMQEPSKDNSGDKIYVTENYVVWNKYTYTTVKTIFYKVDNTYINQDEYNRVSNKDNYERIVLDTIFTRKSDGARVNEEEYNSAKKKSEYKKSVVYQYKYLVDDLFLSETEFREVTKKSNYTIKVETIKNVETQTNEDNNTLFIEDLFIEKYGPIEEHQKWILENSIFVLKNTDQKSENKEQISIEEWVELSEETKALYKKEKLLGDNKNVEISNFEYENLSTELQGFYLISEEVKERTERVKDTHGHIFVKHDLFNHDPELMNCNSNNIYCQNGIAEAFAKFAYDEGLSFALSEEELEIIMHPVNELPF